MLLPIFDLSLIAILANPGEVAAGHDCTAEPESEMQKVTKEEVEQALRPFEHEGFSELHAQRLKKMFREGAGRARAQNFGKKRKKRHEC